jgi:hypothetical protein
MADAIIRVTMLLVLAVAALNLGYAVLLGARLARRVREQHPDRWVRLLVPAWGSPREVAAWFRDWRAILRGSTDPLVATVRRDGRTMMMRHAQLFAWSELWALAVVVIAP